MTRWPPVSGVDADPAVRRLLRLATLAAGVAALSSILLLALSGWFLTAAAIAGTAGPATAFAFNYLIPSAAIRLLAILRTLSRYGERLWSHRAALTAMAELRGTLFGKLAAQDSRRAPDLSGGDASARLLGDIDALEDLVVRRPVRPASLIAAATGIGLAAMAGWASAGALLLLMAALPFLLGIAARRLTREPARDAAEALGALRARYVDYAAARAEIAAYGLAERVTGELTMLTARLDRARTRLHLGEGLLAALLAGYAALAVAAVLAAAARPAPLVALALLATAGAIEAMAAMARTAFRQASVEEGLRRLTALAALDGAPARPAPHPAEPAALRIAGTTLPPGARVALTGPSGSGKTMMLEALAGLRASIGDAAVAGIPLPACTAALLRDQFALSPQDATIIVGSIADNLRLARPGIGEAEMRRALHVACLDERIAAMPDGLDTFLGEAGGRLSGGERKRLSLARALLAGRPWLLLDEPSEGLDAATEARLVGRLGEWLAETGSGLVLVSHRTAPLALADRRIAIDARDPLAA